MGSKILDISIIILTYNRRDCLRELLLEMKGLVSSVREIIIINNCSTDGTSEMIDSEFGEFVHHVTDFNRGVCARNIGMKMALGSVIVTIDDDIMGLSKKDLTWLSNQFENDADLGALNFKVLDWTTHKLCNWVHHRTTGDLDKRFLTYEITEGAVAFRRQALAKTSCYFETYFISHEGPDLAFRLMNAGYRVEYDGTVSVLHKHEQGAREPWRFYYYDTRNQLWLAARNMPFFSGARYLFVGLSAMAVYSIREGYFVWWLRGIKDGLKKLPEMFRTREVWTNSTALLCKRIDSYRPGFWGLVKKRILEPANRLDE